MAGRIKTSLKLYEENSTQPLRDPFTHEFTSQELNIGVETVDIYSIDSALQESYYGPKAGAPKNLNHLMDQNKDKQFMKLTHQDRTTTQYMRQ